MVQTVPDDVGTAGARAPVPSGSVVSQRNISPNAIEPPETFFVNLTGATGATVGDGQGQGHHRRHGHGRLSINDAPAVTEGGNATFTVSLSAASSQPITVTYSTANGSAVAPGDYTATRTAR